MRTWARAAPVAKPKDFKGSLKRLGGYLKPQIVLIVLVLLLGAASVMFNILGPKMLGNATNLVFEGVVGKQLPARRHPGPGGRRAARRRAKTSRPTCSRRWTSRPGQGVDFDALHSSSAWWPSCTCSALCSVGLQQYLMAGVAQRIVYSLRKQVDEKLARLPLKYFDGNPRGDILSRVTNDIDNIAQTLQQSLTQIITAVLTIIGVLAMMFWISPLLAAVSLLTLPLSVVVTMVIAKRSQKQFAAQWERTGKLNGHVEEMHTGHSIVKVFGRQAEAIEIFDAQNEELYEASFRAQFISGIIQPAMNFINNLNYVAIAVIGGLKVANGTMSLGDVQAFIQYSRQFQQPIMQTASIANVLQSTAASAERVFELLDEAEEVAGDRHARQALGKITRPYRHGGRLVPLRARDAAHRGPLARRQAGQHRGDRRSDRRGQDDAREPAACASTRSTAAPSPSTAWTSAISRATTCAARSAWCCRTHGCSAARSARTSPTAERARRKSEILAAARAAYVDHFVRTLPDGLRHRAERRGVEHLGRRAPAAHDRARVPRRPRGAHPRRGDELGRHAHRGADPTCDGRS